MRRQNKKLKPYAYPDFANKRVLLMGLGLHGGGLGTAKFLLQNGANLVVTDLRSKEELFPSIRELEKFKKSCGHRYATLRYTLGRHRRKDIRSADLIVKGPGVKINSPFIKFAKALKIPVTSEMGIFFKYSPASIIGVTGTRGKSTAAYLIWKFLKTKFPRVFLGGNIRKSALEFLPKLKIGDWTVLELSSFQLNDLAKSDLENIKRKSPKIAVFTSILRDHLNWHGTMASYLKAKSYIFRYQKPMDYLFINAHDSRVRALAREAPSRVVAAKLPGDLYATVDKNLGEHYRASVALAWSVARHFKIAPRLIKSILKNFKGLPGRQEKIASIRGITFINDTTSTIPEASIAALKRFYPLAKNKGGKIILIAGGSDKNLDFKTMTKAIQKYAWALVLLPGTATEKIKSEKSKVKDFPRTILAKNMREAVRCAYRLAKKKDYVILSPGAASFGLFLNEFDRGEQFIMAIRELRFKSTINLEHKI
jgi:UDP-N-acetylmuramoylalanine--D-glutamate ligase